MAPVRVSLRSSQRRFKWLSRVSSSPSCVPAPGGVAVAGGSERPDRGPGRSGQSRGGPAGSRSPSSHALLWPLLTTRRRQSAADPAVPGFPQTRRRPRVRGPSRCAGACRPPGCDPEGVPPAPASAPPAWAPVFSKRSRAGHGCHSGGGTRCARRVLRRFRSGRLGPELARVTAASALLWNCGVRSPPPRVSSSSVSPPAFLRVVPTGPSSPSGRSERDRGRRRRGDRKQLRCPERLLRKRESSRAASSFLLPPCESRSGIRV